MIEENLIQEAQQGNVAAMMGLAKYYAEKSGGTNDKVGDVMSIEDFNKMMAATEDGNGDEEAKALAYKYYRMAAEAGNARAMAEVGHRLYDGIGVEKNVEESDIWYKRAAEAGDPSAMRVVAFRSNDDAEKFKYFKLSAELLEPSLNKNDSIEQTAINYATGKGTDKDVAKAEEWLAKLDENDASSTRAKISDLTGETFWLEKAAETSTDAMIKMAERFVLKDDFATALTWYKKAAAKDSADAMSIIGDIYYIGENGVDQDYAAAFEWYNRAARHNHNMAKIKATLMMYRGRGVKQDLQRAFRNFDKIAWTRERFFGPFRFNSVARYYAAKMVESGEGCDKNPVEAVERYKVAGGIERIKDNESARRIPKAIYKVADAYFFGEGVKQNFAKALTFYEKTFTKGDGRTPYHNEAAKKVMWMYEFGEGIPQNKAKAEEWRKKIQED